MVDENILWKWMGSKTDGLTVVLQGFIQPVLLVDLKTRTYVYIFIKYEIFEKSQIDK